MGRYRCSNCLKDMGPCKTEKDSHGFCKLCAIGADLITAEEWHEKFGDKTDEEIHAKEAETKR